MSLSSLIVQREVATIRQVEEALARQVLYGGDLVTNLLEVAQLPEAILVPLLSESVGMPHAPVGELPNPTDAARALVPGELATRRALVPLRLEGGKLVIAVAEPLDAVVVEELSFALGMPIDQRIAPMVRIRQALAASYESPLDRRMRRLIDRLAGIEATEPSSLPPLVRSAVDPHPMPPGAPSDLRTRATPALGSRRPPRPTESGFPGPVAPPPARLPRTDVGFPAPQATGPIVPTPSVSIGSDGTTEPAPPVAPRGRKTAPLAAAVPPTSPAPPAAAAPQPAPAPARPPSAPPPPAATTKSIPPATLMQLARDASTRSSRRHRGPFVLDQAKKEIEEAADRDALLDVFFDFSRQFFDYSAIFVIHGDIAEGRDAYGTGASRVKVLTMGVPLDLPSVLATARERRAAVVTRPAAEGLDVVLMGDLDRNQGTAILVVPVVVRSRVVALFLGDGGESGVDGASQGEVATCAALVGQSFERLIVRRKLQGFSGASVQPPPARVDPKRVSVKPKKPVVIDREAVVAGLEKSTRPTNRPGALRSAASPRAGSVPAPTHPTERDLTPPFPQPARTEPGVRAQPSPAGVRGPEPSSSPKLVAEADVIGPITDRPPPPQAAAVRDISSPSIPREEPDQAGRDEEHAAHPLSLELTPSSPVVHATELDEAAERELLDQLTEEPPVTPAPSTDRQVEPPPVSSSLAVAVPPHRPPRAAFAEGPEAPLPTVIVDVEREFATLVDRFVAEGGDEQAEAELLRQGQHAMPAIMARFPGPIVLSAERIDEMPPPRVTECGPILRLIAGQRRVALPFVLAQLEQPDAEKRFWATYLLTELPYAEAAPAIVARLFDDKERTRRVARLAAKAVAETARESLVEELDRIVRDPQASPQKRIATVETLGEMRDAIVVPVLIGALADENEEVALAARRALMIVSRQDWGSDTRRWLTWWGSNSTRHRIEWLIDALTHEVPAMRRVAGQELKAITKEYFGYYDDLPKKERERAQQRYREWWRTEGRARFRKA